MDNEWLTGYNFARRLVHTKSFKEWELQLTHRQLPECAKLGNFTEQYIECHLRHITLSGAAPVGTCRLGSASDPTTVVDPLLRVKGIKGLRVADASIIPSSLSGDTYATQVMIAEKAADLIRDKDTVLKIKDYFRHLYEVKHKKVIEEEDTHQDQTTNSAAGSHGESKKQ